MTPPRPTWNLRTKRRLLVFAVTALAVLAATVLFDPEATPSRSAVSSSTELRAAVREVERVHGADSAEAADILSKLVQALIAEGPEGLDEAHRLAERSLAIRELVLGPDSPMVADGLEQLAFVLWHQAEFVGTAHHGERRLIERALAIRERATPGDEPGVTRDLHFLSEILRVEGDVGEALSIRERIEPAIRRLHGADSEEMAVHWTRLAALQEMAGDFKRAVESAQRAVSIRDRSLPFDDPRVAASLNALGDLLLKVNDLNGAERAFRRAIDISRSQSAPDPAALARANEHIGDALLERGDWEAARRRFERALGLRRQRFGDGHILVARSLERLGSAERLLGSSADARAHLAAAIAAQSGAATMTRPELARSLHELALLEWGAGRTPEALDAALRTEATSRSHVQFTAGGLSERETLAQARARERGLDLAVTAALSLDDRGELAPEQASRVLDEVIRSRALVLDVVASRRRGLDPHPKAPTASLVDDLMQTLRLVERPPAAGRTEIRGDLARQDTGLAAVRDALPPDVALVSYVRYFEVPREAVRRGEFRYAVFVLRGDAPVPRLFALGPASRIDGAVAAWQASVSEDPRLRQGSDPVAAYLRVAGALAGEIWRPFAGALRGVAQVVIARDGAAQRVSFATLPTEDGDYLASAGPTIAYVGAERDLVARPSGVSASRSLLAIGDPAFGEGATAFPPLPAARDEVAEIASQWSSAEGAIVLSGTAADEAAVKRLAPSCGVLHFATHAFDGAGVCAGRDDAPFGCTGLALAGANGAQRGATSGPADDGILTADEISLLDLRGVEWAVLSACASGSGTIEAGEGILGLERAFRIAGARNVVASLWPVEDDATRAWMRELYAARRAGWSTAESVRYAAVALLARQRRVGGTPHPYAWGGFIAVGDAR